MSNENLNLAEILKDCKKGTKLYSPLFGEVEFNCIHKSFSGGCVIECETECGVWFFNQDGTTTIRDVKSQIIMLYPSKDQQDWSKFKVKSNKPKVKSNKPKFDPKTLQPFDKVLARLDDQGIWYCEWFSFIQKDTNLIKCCGAYYKYCIPYNDDTKHLLATNEEVPEFYRYWDD